MLLKFSNIPVFLVDASRHLKGSNVADLGRQLVVTGAGGLHLFAARDVGSLARAEPERWRLVLERLRVVLVRAWAWHVVHALRDRTFQLCTHRVVRALSLNKA